MKYRICNVLILTFTLSLIGGIPSALAANQKTNDVNTHASAVVPGNLSKILQTKSALTHGRGLDRFPLSFWNYEPLRNPEVAPHFNRAQVKSWAKAGFTIPQLPRYDAGSTKQVNQMRQLLKWSNEYGMKGMIFADGVYKIARKITDNYIEQRQKAVALAVKQFASLDGFWGFAGGDEPKVNTQPSYRTWLDVYHKQVPNIPVYLNLLPYWDGATKLVGYDSWPKYLDDVAQKWHVSVLSFDYYTQNTQGEGGVNGWMRNLRLYREAGWRNSIPFWASPLCVGHWFYEVPNRNMIRWQFNTAICAGASGIRWFSYYISDPSLNYRMAPMDRFWHETSTYKSIQYVQVSFNRHYGDLFNKLVSTKVMCYPKSLGGGAAFKPDALVSKVSIDSHDPNAGLMIGEFVDSKARRYVMFVNLSREQTTKATVTFPGPNVKLHSWNWDGQLTGRAYSSTTPKKVGKNKQATLWLAPGQEAVYRISSDLLAHTPIQIQQSLGVHDK